MTTRIFGFLLTLMIAAAAAKAATVPITVLTYNTYHGGRLDGTTGQLNTIAAQNPDVVVLEEAGYNELATYVDGLNTRFGTTAWHGVYTQLCNAGQAPTCTSYDLTTVMVLTRLKTLATSSIQIWAKDDYHVARPAVQMTVALPDGTPVTIFGVHLPALSDAQASRVTFVNTFQAWAQTFAGPRLAGGDYNDSPGTTPINAMTTQYRDAWKAVGSGTGLTHSSNGTTLTSRIDYWFSDLTSGATAVAAHTAGSLADSDHISLTVTYNVPANPGTVTQTSTETTLYDDAFTTLNKTYWPYGVFTGSQDATIPLAVNAGFHIGALKAGASGSHYNGISSKTFDLSQSGSISAQLVQSPNTATEAYAMFAAGSDGSDFYRWYESGNALVAEKRVAGVKTTLVDLPYDASADAFLRIRRELNAATGTTDVVFETAPNTNGAPGAYTVRYRETWDARVVATEMKCELKAGTSEADVAPGSVTWNHLHVATNSK
ncbi:MAG TPA: endonuclease/exonuclease/phosphatase family protein [Vicinamibacterales bacterium]|nr:endonuclease/exonuclease/phosphatase family protein [Vicinamibacterales bacterium]